VEFIGQAFQLIHGGREPALQVRQIQKVLERLGDFNLLPDFVIKELSEAYVFLRNTEHRLQEVADQQTHQLPIETEGQQRLAYSMGFNSWLTYQKVLNKHQDHVHDHFLQIITAPQIEQTNLSDDGIRKIWDQSLQGSLAVDVLAQFGYDKPEQAYEIIENAHQIRSFRALSQQGRRRLDHLMPLLIGAVGKSSEPTRTLKRLVILLEAIAQRTSYLALLAEYPLALSQLVKLCAASPWISHLLARQPILLDELLDPRTLYVAATRNELIAHLQTRLAAINSNDLEQQMNELRHFKYSNVLRVASVDILDLLPLMQVSDHLTEIAEVVLQSVLNMAWLHMRERHGLPCGVDSGLGEKGLRERGLEEKGLTIDGTQMGFAIIAYGKLGGIELGYGSDLDLVFLYQGDSNAMTDGDKPLANAVFYARLGQRIIHMLQTLTPAGVLYDVDMRLRPNGASGLLVTNVEGFERYQMESAWIWEHQALVRARPVVGDEHIKQSFTQIRQKVLSKSRDVGMLRDEIRAMRERMRKEFSPQLTPQDQCIDLKQGQGGIVDIEFMVQYMVLANAAANPDLMTYTDVVRILESCAEKRLITSETGSQLSDIYREYRSRVHRLKLQEKSASIGAREYEDQRKLVSQMWQSLMFD
jgi:glutamate-ammonia-ligase adenylyltransferase